MTIISPISTITSSLSAQTIINGALRANQNTPNASTTSIYVGASMQVTRI